MIREHRPGFEPPAEIRRYLEEAAMQNRQSRLAGEMVHARIGAGRDKVSPANTQAMFRGVWPRDFVSGHEMQGDNFGLRWQVERDTAFHARGRLTFQYPSCARKRRRRFALPAQSMTFV